VSQAKEQNFNGEKRILFFFPSVANNPEIPKAISILAGISKKHYWVIDYFDAYVYGKPQDSFEARGNSGEYKHAEIKHNNSKEYHYLLKDLQEKIDLFAPRVIAISCMSFEYEFLVKFWCDIKVPAHTLVVIGGIHSILKPDEVAGSGLFDIVCYSEGEEAFEEILIKLDSCQDIRYVDSTIFCNSEDGGTIRNKRGMLIDEKNLWGFLPDYSFLDDKYFIYPHQGKLYRRTRIEVGRGCPYDCTYCANSALTEATRGSGRFVRKRPIETMKSEMDFLLNEQNVELFYLDDECFLSSPKEWLNVFLIGMVVRFKSLLLFKQGLKL
jgi:hypothetical protein